MNAASPTRSPRRILVADDSPLNRRLASQLLRQQGHHVTVVNNGQEALASLAKHGFDAILMDIDMPEMDGLTATRRIRAAEARTGGRVPIVAVTTQNNALECLQAGMDAHLEKPLRIVPLGQVLELLSCRKAA